MAGCLKTGHSAWLPFATCLISGHLAQLKTKQFPYSYRFILCNPASYLVVSQKNPFRHTICNIKINSGEKTKSVDFSQAVKYCLRHGSKEL